MNYFSIFGLPVYYHIDMQELTSRFQNLQRQYHPDNFVESSQEELLTITKWSATINQAWQTLRDPLNRAEYFLSLYGFDPNDKKYIKHNTPFLIEQVLLREELNTIKQTNNKVLLKKFIKKNKGIFNAYYKQMVVELDNRMWENAVNIIHKLRFFNKIHSLAKQIEEELF